jgi:hypothetical protein
LDFIHIARRPRVVAVARADAPSARADARATTIARVAIASSSSDVAVSCVAPRRTTRRRATTAMDADRTHAHTDHEKDPKTTRALARRLKIEDWRRRDDGAAHTRARGRRARCRRETRSPSRC